MMRVDKQLHARKRNILKLLLNIFVRKPVKFFGKNVKIPHFDIAFSPMSAFPKIISATHKYIILYDAIPLLLPGYYPSVGIKKHWFYKLTEYIKTKPVCKYFAISESCKNEFFSVKIIYP